MATNPNDERELVRAVMIVGLAFVTGATIVGVLIALPESQNPAIVLTLLLGFFGTFVPQLANLTLGRRTNAKLDRVLNGEMDAKIKRGALAALEEHTAPADDAEATP